MSRPTLPNNGILFDQGVGDLAGEILGGLELANRQAPWMFTRGIELVRVRRDEAILETMTPEVLLYEASHAFRWMKEQRDKDGALAGFKEAAGVPQPVKEAVRHIHKMPSWPFPRINRVTTVPVFSSEGVLVTTPGFDAASGIYLRTDQSWLPVSERATATQAATAARWIINELLIDFPFKDASDVAHALAGLVLPFVRSLIPGPTPIHTITAPAHNQGKTLLAQAMAYPATGSEEVMGPLSGDKAETRKRITALLSSGVATVVIDNQAGTLDSPDLANVITSENYRDRELGKNTKLLLLPNNLTWILTANNAKFSREIGRRMIPIRLDRGEETDIREEAFRHFPLIPWAARMRKVTVHHALTMAQAWLNEGRPAGTAPQLGSFEVHSSTMSGVLDVAGVKGFMQNREEWNDQYNLDAVQWKMFTQSWFNSFGSDVKKAGELLNLYDTIESDWLKLGTGRQKFVNLGNRLQENRDRVIGDYTLRVTGHKGSGSWGYWLDPKDGDSS